MLVLNPIAIDDNQVSDIEPQKKTEAIENAPTIKIVETEAESTSVPSNSLVKQSEVAHNKDNSSQSAPSMHVAMPVLKYYWLRFTNFAVDFALTAFSYILVLLCIALILCNGIAISAPIHWSVCFIWPFIVFVALKFHRGLGGYSESRLHVVDASGVPITPKRSLARALAFALTWFLFPVHLVLMATGSRQLLHDSLTGCYVVSRGEHPAKSIYPPAPKWIAILLVVGSVWCVFSLEQVRMQWDRLELGALQVLLGAKNPLYASYLGAKCDLSPAEITEFSQDKAEKLLPRFESLADLRSEFTSLSGNDGNSILQVYKAALVAARANKPALTAHFLEMLREVPGIDIERALGARWIDVMEFETSSSIRAANLMRKVGHRDVAIALAKAEKESAEKAGDRDRLQESVKLIDLATTQEPGYDPFAPEDTYDDTAKSMREIRVQLRDLDDIEKQ